MTAAAADAATKAAYKEAAIQVGKGIAIGAVPVLGQAIDAYDTIESCIALHDATTAEAKEEAEFDLVLALIGWIPGPGDGVKKSLRLVNRDPERFAPVLFDLLRFILSECGIKTSPEELLAQVFNSSALGAEIDEVIKGVKSSSTYKAAPAWAKTIIIDGLAEARDQMPRLIGIVERRLLKWKKVQRNSSAEASISEKAPSTTKPAAKDASVASEGHDGASTSHSNQSEKSTLGQKVLSELTNEGLGVSGEHIADYICAEKFGWGKDWDGHDKGKDGKWLEGLPSTVKLGKLSHGGAPKEQHILYKLTDGANGTGIDAVWRATPENNNGKKFAVIEAKASKNEDAPKFARKIPVTRKPAITSKLGVSGIADAFELLEPIESTESDSSATRGTFSKKKVATSRADGKAESKAKNTDVGILVQMSREWISFNLKKMFGEIMATQIIQSYSRHLFFAPLYHLSGSPKAHAEARLPGADTTHSDHDAFHYNETEVKRAVNKRKKALVSKHGAMSTLAQEA